MAVALDDEARGLVVLAGDRDFYGQCERVVLAGLGQYDKFRTLVDARHEHTAVITHGADDERRLHVMLAEALLDNGRQELLKAFVHPPSLPVELDDLATGFCALALKDWISRSRAGSIPRWSGYGAVVHVDEREV
jgi:hypothetical protein